MTELLNLEGKLQIMKRQLFLLFYLSTALAFSQSSSKEYRKDIALYRAKFYIINEVLGGTSEYEKFVIELFPAISK